MEDKKTNSNNNEKKEETNTNNNNNANEKEQEDKEEIKDKVCEMDEPNNMKNEEMIIISPEEEIDKAKLKEEIENEMDLEDEGNNDNFINEDIDNQFNEDNNNKNDEEEEEIINKEYPDFATKGEIYSINFHQQSGTLIIGDGEDTTYFYNLDKKEIIKEQKLNKDSVNFIKFSSDNKYLLTTSVDGTINIFKTENNFELINTISDQDSEINWVEWHPKGPAFSFGTSDGSVWVYMASNIKNNFNFFSHTASTTCGSFIGDGKKLISGGEDARIKIYDLKDKKVIHSIEGEKFIKSPITCLDVCKSKEIAVCCSITNEFSIIHYKNGSVLFYRQFPSSSDEAACSIEDVCFCNGDQYIVFADSENHLNIFEMKNNSLRSSISVNGDNLTKIIPSNKKTYEIYCSSTNGYMYIFDTRGIGSVLLREKVHKDAIMDFVVTENENFIITSSIDKTINLVKIVNLED